MLEIITIQEDDGDVHNHGAVELPKGMSKNKAIKKIDEIFRTVVDSNPSEWNYDDVFRALKKSGFKRVNVTQWWEH